LGLSSEVVNAKSTVLVTDDDEAVRESVADILALSGYDVLQATDGGEALRVLAQQSVDVLLLDMAMPNVDGLSVLEALGPPPPKVVLLSAFAYYSPEDIDRKGLSEKITRTLHKPCQPAELLAAVNDAIAGLTGRRVASRAG